VFYTIAVASFFAGIAMIGGVRTSLVMNLEPIASIALGFILLSQVLSERQLLGAALVILAVTAVKWLSGKKAAS
jgi:drug/metabolite transporter (DMT)-like permease